MYNYPLVGCDVDTAVVQQFALTGPKHAQGEQFLVMVGLGAEVLDMLDDFSYSLDTNQLAGNVYIFSTGPSLIKVEISVHDSMVDNGGSRGGEFFVKLVPQC